MDKNIANNIRNILKAYYQSYGKSLDERKTQFLGNVLAKEIVKLPPNEHILAWNIIRESFESHLKSELQKGFFSKINNEVGVGAAVILKTSQDRENFIKGFTLFKLDPNFIPTLTDKVANSKYL
jgi:hypothetical protein